MYIMKIEQVKVTIISCIRKSGTAKRTGNTYDFYTVEFVDEDYNKFSAPVPSSALIGGVVPEWIREASNTEAIVDVNITPARQGFGINLTLDGIEEA